MSSEEEDILRSRENLQNALGPKYIDYMQSMRKWLSGKISKQEFDNEAREIVTQNYVHLHNDFLLCIISKCNNFSANANEAATKTIFPTVKSAQSVQRVKRKLRSDSKSAKSNSYHLRFVPVDPVKHAPSLLTASIDSTVAALNQEDFSLEFCARERCLPYARMIHGRMLLTAFDFNLKSVDAKAVFLLAEATVWMLRNMIGKLVDRSRFKHSLRVESEFDKYKRTVDSTLLDRSRRHNLEPDKNVLKEFELDSELLRELLGTDSDQMEWSESTTTTTTPIEATTTTKIEVEDPDRVYLNQLSDPRQNPAIVSTRRLPITLYDLKNLLQLRNKSTKSLMPSHSVYTINMERLIMNLWHPDNDDIENSD